MFKNIENFAVPISSLTSSSVGLSDKEIKINSFKSHILERISFFDGYYQDILRKCSDGSRCYDQNVGLLERTNNIRTIIRNLVVSDFNDEILTFNSSSYSNTNMLNSVFFNTYITNSDILSSDIVNIPNISQNFICLLNQVTDSNCICTSGILDCGATTTAAPTTAAPTTAAPTTAAPTTAAPTTAGPTTAAPETEELRQSRKSSRASNTKVDGKTIGIIIGVIVAVIIIILISYYFYRKYHVKNNNIKTKLE